MSGPCSDGLRTVLRDRPGIAIASIGRLLLVHQLLGYRASIRGCRWTSRLVAPNSRLDRFCILRLLAVGFASGPYLERLEKRTLFLVLLILAQIFVAVAGPRGLLVDVQSA